MPEGLNKYVIATPPTGVGVQLVPYASTGSLTLSGVPTDGDQFSVVVDNIAAQVYTAKTALTPTAGQFLIGGSAAAAMANLYAAMTGGPGSGTAYAAGTVAIASTPTAGMLALVPSGQAALIAAPPNASNTIVLYNGVGWAYTLATPTNVSTFLGSVAFATNTGLRKPSGRLHVVNIRPAAAGATLNIYDSAQVTGAGAGNLMCLMDAQAAWTNNVDYLGRLQFLNGLYAVLTSTSGSFQVTYE